MKQLTFHQNLNFNVNLDWKKKKMKLIINEQFINHVSNTHCSNINQKSYMENHSHAKQEVVYCGRQEQYFLQDAQQSF